MLLNQESAASSKTEWATLVIIFDDKEMNGHETITP